MKCWMVLPQYINLSLQYYAKSVVAGDISLKIFFTFLHAVDAFTFHPLEDELR